MQKAMLKAIYVEFTYVENRTIYYSQDFSELVDPYDDYSNSHTNLMKRIADVLDFERDIDHYEHFVTISNFTDSRCKSRMIYVCNQKNILCPRITLYSYGNSFEEANDMMNKTIDILKQYREDK